ncbi:RIP metalloprotease RseP [Qipengyuania sp. 6B39]|uniref:RIP metalloprotease RseP n=1 Tax=Qipengyuania proteolytica TaxID=2867239 RepID=UPI001C8AE637|nr:RIP metalloprotease RseP [Qipengyuania proteolytica]MBX7495709.1 RIP metalloprotease RseP [Qipengyuania proteolytica]
MENLLPLWVYYVLGFPLLLGPLVTVHELGHYLVGRWFGVHAEAFSVGFGKEIWGFTDKRGTRWKLSALPLGGYVQFKGDMNPASVPDPAAIEQASAEEREGSFHHAALWKRALIVFAGPATNILVTLAIFASFFAFYGKPVPADAEQQLTIAEFAEVSPAREAGLREGDRILSVEGEAMESFRDVQDAIMMYPGRTLDIAVKRDGRRETFAVPVGVHEMEDRFGNVSKIGLVGIQAAAAAYDYEPQGLVSSMGLAVDHSIGVVDMMLTGIGQIVSGERSVQELGGPVKIAKFSGEQLSMGALAFINFVALISLNLAFINLLPIPALDGGHLAFYAAEAVRRKPVGPRGTEVAYRAGVALVLALMVFVTINDLAGLPIFGK